MATRKYSANPEDKMQDVTEAVGSAFAKRVVLTVDWDSMATDGLSGQQARLQVQLALEKIMDYIETTGKYNVAA